MLALDVYSGDKVRQIHKALASNHLQRTLEFILEADARLVAIDHDRALNDPRFHEDTPCCNRIATANNKIRSTP
jgi:hypothetical protein